MDRHPKVKERPTRTPEGFEFPYSHFGDTDKRTQLLIDIAEVIQLKPQVVVNVGSGYDITPSDAFPYARVIHVDIAPKIVQFLGEAGFESYIPQDIPTGIKADLIIDILGPSSLGIPISPQGVILTTNKKWIPEGMGVAGLVDNSDPPIIVNDDESMQALWEDNEGQRVHLVALTHIWHS